MYHNIEQLSNSWKNQMEQHPGTWLFSNDNKSCDIISDR